MAGATAVVCAAFDEASDAALGALRDRAEALGLRVRRAHRPHLTLGAARVLPGEDLDALIGVAGAIASTRACVPLWFTRIGTFGNGTLWLGPSPTPALADLQRTVHETLERAGWPPAFGPHSHPDDWVAHCTLATRVPRDRLAEARAALRETDRPLVATVDALVVLLVGGTGDVAWLPLSG